MSEKMTYSMKVTPRERDILRRVGKSKIIELCEREYTSWDRVSSRLDDLREDVAKVRIDIEKMRADMEQIKAAIVSVMQGLESFVEQQGAQQKQQKQQDINIDLLLRDDKNGW